MDVRSYARLPTEKPHPRSAGLDRLSPGGQFDLMNQDNFAAAKAVASVKRDVLRAVNLLVDRMSRGGRVFLVGAGTSGRLCVLEAAECPPTFGTSPTLVQALMAGGRPSVFRSKEGAEDQAQELEKKLGSLLQPSDVVVAVAASGVTAFAGAALVLARRRRAATVFVTCNPQSSVPADARVRLRTGPEVLAGSTRLKAGTATKMILNMLTTLTMVRLGKVYGPWMVDLQPRSKKLVARATHLISLLGRTSTAEAASLLRRSGGKVKTAIVMARHGVSRFEAERRLVQAGGFLREVLIP
ncbi:MAG: N-acetylmuramic acid 6-phosphate etherase [Elusimicrobia bacterium]|nr:N-acetylmuramic acid 6-phosphate etherase [Elusimicrobiota bacterium]